MSTRKSKMKNQKQLKKLPKNQTVYIPFVISEKFERKFKNYKEFIESLMSFNFLCNKKRNWPLFNFNEVSIRYNNIAYMGDYEKIKKNPLLYPIIDNSVLKVPYVMGYYRPDNFENYTRKLNYNVLNTIKKEIPVIYDILNILPGKIHLCGGSVVDLIYLKKIPQMSDFDIFLSEITEEQAFNVVKEIVKKITTYNEDTENKDTIALSYFVRTGKSLTFVCTNYFNNQPIVNFKLQIITRIYKSLGEILGGFDLWASRVGVNTNGLFATKEGVYSVSQGVLPVDLSKRSTTFEYRLRKYRNQKLFTLVFPGVVKDFESDKFKTQNNEIRVNNRINDYDIDPEDSSFYSINVEMLRKDYLENSHKFVIKYDGSIHRPLFKNYQKQLINENNKNKLSESEFIYEQIINPCNIVLLYNSGLLKHEPSVIERLINSNDEKINYNWNFTLPDPRAIRDLFSLNSNCMEKYNDFVLANYSYPRNKEKCSELINFVFNEYVTIFKEVMVKNNNNFWLTVDPGRQAFGSFNPAICDPREWYGPDYNPVYAGLHPDIYVLLRSARKTHPLWSLLPKDVFNLIIEWVLCF